MIAVSYSVFVTVAAMAPVFYAPIEVSGDTAYTLWAASKDLIVSSEAVGDDATAFEANIKPSATQVGSAEEARLRGVIATVGSIGAAITPDGRTIVATSSIPSGCIYYVAGCGDGESIRGDGEAQYLSHSGATPETLADAYSDFLDVLYIEGGIIQWAGARAGDWITVGVQIPATPVTSTPGAGNCNQVANAWGGYTLIPAANGSHTVDLGDACPIPASIDDTVKPTGYWDWSSPTIGRGTISAGVPGAAGYHLSTVAPPEVRFVNRFPMLGDGQIDLRPPTKGRRMLPHWRFFARVHSAGRVTGTLEVSWAIKCGRYRTS